MFNFDIKYTYNVYTYNVGINTEYTLAEFLKVGIRYERLNKQKGTIIHRVFRIWVVVSVEGDMIRFAF